MEQFWICTGIWIVMLLDKLDTVCRSFFLLRYFTFAGSRENDEQVFSLLFQSLVRCLIPEETHV
jgi:hypothetical protein